MSTKRIPGGLMLALVTGVVTLVLAGCPTSTGDTSTSELTGAAADGEATFAASCARCHSASSLRNTGSLITTNLGNLSSSMRGITLTDQQVSDLRAYLATQ